MVEDEESDQVSRVRDSGSINLSGIWLKLDNAKRNTEVGLVGKVQGSLNRVWYKTVVKPTHLSGVNLNIIFSM